MYQILFLELFRNKESLIHILKVLLEQVLWDALSAAKKI
jgi:hypothetical protein